jgi:uncharacterized protein YbaP (TraB family)
MRLSTFSALRRDREHLSLDNGLVQWERVRNHVPGDKYLLFVSDGITVVGVCELHVPGATHQSL